MIWLNIRIKLVNNLIRTKFKIRDKMEDKNVILPKKKKVQSEIPVSFAQFKEIQWPNECAFEG